MVLKHVAAEVVNNLQEKRYQEMIETGKILTIYIVCFNGI
jgi:hypothetical protein